MQNNNRRNILLFLILVVLVVIAFLIARGDRNIAVAPTGFVSTNQISSNQDVLPEEKDLTPTPEPEPEDPAVVFLKSLVSTYPSAEIKECSWADGRQFILNKNTMIADGPIYIYSSSGVLMDTCSTFYDPDTYTPSAYCQAIPGGCTSVIYNSTVDKYNLN